MFGQREASILQRAIPMVVGLIGVACCLLALSDMRSQQANDLPPATSNPDMTPAHQAPHHMRGWQIHRGLS